MTDVLSRPRWSTPRRFAARWTIESPGSDTGREVWQMACALDPWGAMFRLLEAVVDGGECTHCGKPTAVDDVPADSLLDAVGALLCFYRYDPELQTFRRMCEGVAV